MQKLSNDDLMPLERYARERSDFRARVMAHKRNRRVALGPHATLYFEDRLTIQYQIQEMLRAERIFEPDGIAEELESYNPLIPDGSNWKATFMLEYPDAEQRKVELTKLIGVEDKVWMQVHEFPRIYAIADEDLERENDEKTSSVHFLRFELDEAMREAVLKGAPVACGVEHPNLSKDIDILPAPVRDALAQDLA